MYGRKIWNGRAQLALMDALVFFAISITISGILFFYVHERVVTPCGQSIDGQSDPGAILGVFLGASLGVDLSLEVSGEVQVSANTNIADCIAAELDALALGASMTDFSLMNERFIDVLNTVCSPSMDPYLAVFEQSGADTRPILSLPGQIPDSDTRYSASTRLPGVRESAYILVLALLPCSTSIRAF